jgi:hypothetical protein
MIQQLTTPQQVLPTLAVDSKDRLVAVVVSADVVGVCMKRLGPEALTTATYRERLQQEAWGTLIRQHDGVFFITVAGLIPTEEDWCPTLIAKADNMEAVHMAIEIGLAVWPEWGGALRLRFTPKHAILVHLTGQPIEA